MSSQPALRTNRVLLQFFLTFFLLIGVFTQPALPETYQFINKWGEGPYNHLTYPQGVAVDPFGYVYVVDSNRVLKFSPDGSLITRWGSTGTGLGQFSGAMRIAIDNSGNVHVSEPGSNRIQKFTPDGVFLAAYQASGTGDGQFNHPTYMAFDGAGNGYVVDSGNHRIQKFSPNAVFITKWGSYGSEDGQFNNIQGLAVDSSGNVYVSDQNNHRIQKFTSNGVFLTKWGSPGNGDGQFYWTEGIAVDSSGNVYVVDSYNHRIQKFTSDGVFLTKWGSSGFGDGQFSWSEGIAVDSSGNVYVIENGFETPRIQKFSSEGAFLAKWASIDGDGVVGNPRGVALDRSKIVFVADTGNHRIQKFTTDGIFLGKWGSYGSEDGQFAGPRSIAFDQTGNVYVADSLNNRIQKFTSDGTFITKWGTFGTGDGQFDRPYGVAVDKTGFVYVADYGNHRVQKFTSDGVFITKWGFLYYPHGIAVDDLGYVYVAFGSSGLGLEKFTSDGSYVFVDYCFRSYCINETTGEKPDEIKKWDVTNFLTQEIYPLGKEMPLYDINLQPHFGSLAVDRWGNVYVGYDSYVVKMRPDGQLITRIGRHGSGDGHFWWNPYGIAIDERGNIFVTDSRVQVFIPTPDKPRAITNPASNVKLNQATLNGNVTPNLLVTLYWFEWGTSTAYGNSTDLQITDIGLGSVDVNASLTGLTANTTYHCRLVALNDAGISYGVDKSFKTIGAPLPWLMLLLED